MISLDYEESADAGKLEEELSAGQPKDFSREEEDANQWILTMKAYFDINRDIYDEKAWVLITLNKIGRGRGTTLSKGWYLKLDDEEIPNSEKTFKKLCDAFALAFISKDIADQA